MKRMTLHSILTHLCLIMCTAGAVCQNHYLPNPTLLIEHDTTPADIKACYVSYDGSKLLSTENLKFDDSSRDKSEGMININTNQLYQEIDGFGFAITGSASYNLSKMEAYRRHDFLVRTFSPDENVGYGCSYLRVPIGCSDFSLSDYTCCDTPGIENFALTNEETRYIIPVLQEILQINPDIKIIGAPWTAPRWMKTNGEWTAGHLREECYQDYALYFVKWIKAFAENGIHITAVTPQNEPLHGGNSASMFMLWEEQRDFIKTALGPSFSDNNIDTKIYVFDHNYSYDNWEGQIGYPSLIYSDSQAKQYISGAAYHNYSGDASEMTAIHDANPDMALLFTEWTAGEWYLRVDHARILEDVKNLIFDVVNNWGRGAIVWNMILDNNHGPYRPGGCFNGNGAVDIDIETYGKITYNSFYYTICLAMTASRPGGHRASVDGNVADTEFVAFSNPDGTTGIIATNNSVNAKKVTIYDGKRYFCIDIPPLTAASYRWQ